MKHLKLKLLALALVAMALAVPSSSLAAAPGATTGKATAIGDTSATLNGVATANKEATTFHFEYGTSTAYGTNTPELGAGSNKKQNVSAGITGLAPSTVYHFRLVTTNPSGTARGADATFTTAAPGTTQPGSNAITLTATPASVTFGRATTLAGKVTGQGNGGVSVSLEQDAFPFTSGFKALTGATTDANGNFSFSAVLPLSNTRYQAVAKTKPPVTSAAVQVNVRLAVTRRVSAATIKSGQRVRFSGIVKPAHIGKLVRIQRRTSTGKYRTVSKTLTKASTGDQSKYSKRVRITRTGVYRVRVYPADGDHVAGTSRTKRIRVIG
jgi:hypothetical protein